jgi:hypothetical protein
MPTFKISGLPAAAEVSVTDEFETNQAGTSRKATASQIRAGLAASGANSDITSLSGLTTPLSTSQGGTGLSTLGTAGQVLTVNNDGDGLQYAAPGGDPIGTLQYFAGATTSTYPGSEWLVCDSSILTQTAYPALYDRIGLIADGGVIWTARTSGITSSINALIYGDNLYVYGGFNGALRTSTDAITWTARTSGTGSSILALTYGNNLYVYAGAGGALATSTDAITWTARTSGAGGLSINALIYGDNLYVWAGDGGFLRTSTDAITWTARTSNTTSSILALTYGNTLYVYAGAGSALATSTDAITWTARISGIVNALHTLAYGDNLYVYGGTGGNLRTSPEYTYNLATEFALPAQQLFVDSTQAPLYIKVV